MQWSSWSEFREPSEFIETVPFTQTRDYVQIILRNADIYRRLYADSTGQLSYSSDDPTAQKIAAAAPIGKAQPAVAKTRATKSAALKKRTGAGQ